MRRAFFLIPLLVVSLVAQATKVGGSGATKVGGSGSTKITAFSQTYTPAEVFGSNAAQAATLGSTASRTYAAGDVTIGVASFTCTRARIVIGRVGTGTPVLTGYIWSNTASAPGTLLGTSTNTVDGTLLATGGGNADFNFAGVALTNGTRYWIGVSAGSIDGSNYSPLRGGATASGPFQDISTAGSTWSFSVDRPINVTLYSSP